MSTQCDRSCVAVFMQSATPGTAQAMTATELAGVALAARIEPISPTAQSRGLRPCGALQSPTACGVQEQAARAHIAG